MRRCLAAVAAAVVMVVGMGIHPAQAHANLLKSSIKNNQIFHVGHTPTVVTGTFAELLDPSRSWMAVFEGVGDHGLVTEKQKSRVNFNNPKQMILKLPRTLTREKYYLIWYTRSEADGHLAAGIVYFQVK